MNSRPRCSRAVYWRSALPRSDHTDSVLSRQRRFRFTVTALWLSACNLKATKGLIISFASACRYHHAAGKHSVGLSPGPRHRNGPGRCSFQPIDRGMGRVFASRISVATNTVYCWLFTWQNVLVLFAGTATSIQRLERQPSNSSACTRLPPFSTPEPGSGERKHLHCYSGDIDFHSACIFRICGC